MNLNDHFKLPFIDALVASKTAETIAPANLDWPFHAARLDGLEKQLESAFAESELPDNPDRQTVNDLLISIVSGVCTEKAGFRHF